MREITTHTVDPDDKLKLFATDEPGHGGAHHRYQVDCGNLGSNPSCCPGDDALGDDVLVILFQNGPVREHGINGVTEAALLAIVLDRLEAFQRGAYANVQNLHAIAHLEKALECLHVRTRERLARNVEGTSER